MFLRIGLNLLFLCICVLPLRLALKVYYISVLLDGMSCSVNSYGNLLVLDIISLIKHGLC